MSASRLFFFPPSRIRYKPQLQFSCMLSRRGPHPALSGGLVAVHQYGSTSVGSGGPIPAARVEARVGAGAGWTRGKLLTLFLLTGISAFAAGRASWTQAGPSAGVAAAAVSPSSPFSGHPQYGTLEKMMKAVGEIQAVLGEDAISMDDEVLKHHGYSAWSTTNVDVLPVAVAYPNTTQETAEIAKICQKYRVPIIPFSGGSSLEGNFSAPFGGISVDFTHMNKILAFHEDDMDVVVQPGVSWMDLNEKIKHSGLFFPVDPGPSAKIGGMVGTNCSGTNAVRYGTMKDWVINMTVVLADGTIIKTKRRPRKSAAGYNLNHLFVGSEGTLGLATEITLKLAVIPEETSVAVVAFPTIRDAAAAASKVMRTGIPVAAMEIMDEVQMSVVNRSGITGRQWPECPTLFFKFSGTKVGVQDNISTVQRIAKLHRGGKFEFAKNEEEQRTLWSARKESLWSMLALRKHGQEVWSTDVAVPLSRLADLIEISKKEMDELNLFASVLGHIGDGNFHESIMYDKANPDEVHRVEKVVHNMVDRALDMEGTCTGEHGVGIGKKEFLVKELGLETLGVMKKLKLALDPLWLMNPGKIVDYTTKTPMPESKA